MARRFEFSSGPSGKFWEIDHQGRTVTVRFGKLATTGQSRSKTHPSPATAAREADRLVREKLAKGYVELGAAPAAGPGPAVAPGKKAARKPAPPPAAPQGPPGKFAFTPGLDELYARGYPYLRVLTDEAVPAKIAAREARKGLQAIDPYFPVAIPRGVATRYLRGYTFEPFKQVAQLERAVQDDSPVDLALLDAVLEAKVRPSRSHSYGGETYDFRLNEVTFLFEAFLGTEVVAERLVAHLVAAREHPRWWGDAFFRDHQNADAQRIAVSLGWLRLRLPPRRWKELVAPLRGKQPALPRFVARLSCLVDDRAHEEDPRYSCAFAMQRRQKGPLKEALARWKHYWQDPQLFYVLGAEHLLDVELQELPRLPKWWQLRIIREFGTLRAPGAVRAIAGLLSSRSAGEAARDWLRAHQDHVEREALPVLARQDPALVSAVKAALSGAVQPPHATPRQLEKELGALLRGVGGALAAQGGDPKKELAVLRAAFARYAEIRAALGEVIPEAYFTHHLADVTPDWQCDQATLTRWIDLAVEAAS